MGQCERRKYLRASFRSGGVVVELVVVAVVVVVVVVVVRNDMRRRTGAKSMEEQSRWRRRVNTGDYPIPRWELARPERWLVRVPFWDVLALALTLRHIQTSGHENRARRRVWCAFLREGRRFWILRAPPCFAGCFDVICLLFGGLFALCGVL